MTGLFYQGVTKNDKGLQRMNMRLLITGGAGFIGSTLIRHLINDLNYSIINLDKLTYAGNLDSLGDIIYSPNYFFEKVDICNYQEVKKVFENYNPDKIMHLAAESHVDRSIDGPSEFIQTNIVGTYNLLEISKEYWLSLTGEKKNNFRFHHISSDEVYGDLTDMNKKFTEDTAYLPSSPYSASKAGSDHLVRAWNRTYGLPVVISNSSNNYGPYQFPEKLMPLIILNAIEGKKLPVYGKGDQIRDWLYVEDHAQALVKILFDGADGETYNLGGCNEMQNIEVVKKICEVLDELVPKKPLGIKKYEELMSYVKDRPGHDKRYAIDNTKIQKNLGWKPKQTFESGIRKTVEWYLNNQVWCERVQGGSYQRERLGLNNK